MTVCPHCDSEKVRRGGFATWLVYVALIAVALPAVLLLQLNAALVAAAFVAAAFAAHLVLRQQVCLDCGKQWRRET